MVKGLIVFRYLETYLLVLVQRAIQFHKEPLACAELNQVQHRLAKNTPEHESHTAVNTPHAYGINKRHREQCTGTDLVHVADKSQVFVIPALLIGLQVNGIERASLQLAPLTLVSDVFQVHNRVGFQIRMQN